jgi:hypothetical protein
MHRRKRRVRRERETRFVFKSKQRNYRPLARAPLWKSGCKTHRCESLICSKQGARAGKAWNMAVSSPRDDEHSPHVEGLGAHHGAHGACTTRRYSSSHGSWRLNLQKRVRRFSKARDPRGPIPARRRER